MGRPVCYDITRLLTRILNATPNGIDRVDYALAQHFLAGDPASTFGTAFVGVGSRLLKGVAAREAVNGIAAHWGETSEVDSDPTYRHVVARLTGQNAGPKPPRRRPKHKLPFPVSAIGYWAARHGVPVRTTPRAHLPRGGVYVNVSQFPLWLSGPFEWLKARQDVRAAFFVHDLLPIVMPEYFRIDEHERHQRRLRNVARFASAAIVTTRTVADSLETHLHQVGRRDLPVFAAPTPISPTFAMPRCVDPRLGARPYFVLCSTIEPRKNHLMILAVWRALAQKLGRDTPKLVVVGVRGWHYDPIIDLIERSPLLREHVIEVGGLSTPGLKRLIDNAQALLMPSFGEGYGLPVHEALVAGAPVVASDISAFREIEGEGLTLLSPLDGEAWLHEIEWRSRTPRESVPAGRLAPVDWASYFVKLDAFIATL